MHLVYIVIHRQTVSLHHSCSMWLYVRLSINPLSQQAYHVGSENYKAICRNSSSSVRLFTFSTLQDTRVLNSFEHLHYASGSRKFLRQSAEPPWGGVYCHPQTDCFALSQLFSVAKHVGRSKLGSKSAQLYVRLCIRPLCQQTYHVGLGNYKVLCSNSSSRSVEFF